MGGACVVRQALRFGQQRDLDLMSPALQQCGRLQAVAAVVARSAGDPDALRMRREVSLELICVMSLRFLTMTLPSGYSAAPTWRRDTFAPSWESLPQ